MTSVVSGFSKLSKSEKIRWINNELQDDPEFYKKFWVQDEELQKIFDEFSENTITNFILPMGLAPNFLINNKNYTVPMVTEESSVVAAASKAAKFWLNRGGFKATVTSTVKVGHVHLEFTGDKKELFSFFNENKKNLFDEVKDIEINMKKRGGGLKDINLLDMTSLLKNYFKLEMKFETCDAMGANFINTILEKIASFFEREFNKTSKDNLKIIMSILSNYTSDCIVKVGVDAKVSDLAHETLGISGAEFAHKFVKAVEIATFDITRAVTHNKGIMNGIDSVVIATGNDFRAIEACAHAYAARDGQYRSLTKARIEGDHFYFELEIPLALGTVGGLTRLHPVSKKALEILENPNAKELMMITASVGLAQNFAAIKSLVTTGIQKGHMKMHLLNILNGLNATPEHIKSAKEYFCDKVVSYSEVRSFIASLRYEQ